MDETPVKHTKVLGDRSTAYVLARLLEVYETVLLPFGENQRYDLVVETNDGEFLRVQCKTGRLRGGAIFFPTASSTYHHPNALGSSGNSHHYRGQADFFGVYCPETDDVYLVPVEEVGIRMGALRVDPPRNNQSRGIRWAADFRIGRSAGQWITARSRRPPEQPPLLRERAVPYLLAVSPG